MMRTISTAIILLMWSCSTRTLTNETTVRERIHVIDGYSTSAAVTLSTLEVQPLTVMHNTRTNDTILRVIRRNDTIFADVNCPDDTVRLYDTLRIEMTQYKEKSGITAYTEFINGLILLALVVGVALFLWRWQK